MSRLCLTCLTKFCLIQNASIRDLLKKGDRIVKMGLVDHMTESRDNHTTCKTKLRISFSINFKMFVKLPKVNNLRTGVRPRELKGSFIMSLSLGVK